MIKADKLSMLSNMSAALLTTAIRQAGYKKDVFINSKFLGLSNGNEFVYSVTYVEDGDEYITKVFVKYDPVEDKVSVDY